VNSFVSFIMGLVDLVCTVGGQRQGDSIQRPVVYWKQAGRQAAKDRIKKGFNERAVRSFL
jgi:hypothetical protein